MADSETKPQPCNCIEEVNGLIEKQGSNTMLMTNLFGPPKVFVATCKRDEEIARLEEQAGRGARQTLPVLWRRLPEGRGDGSRLTHPFQRIQRP